MNLLHRWYCGSSRWAALVEEALLPWALELEGVALGAELLELGPGPGVTTEVLRRRVARLTAVELDAALAARLARRLPRPGV
jgi:16S rRNA A1518/A1519 N6-dimethyltransferase RsmA/KsgA/DIM1 with predicted DNA glycosylase/AP lyase activity